MQDLLFKDSKKNKSFVVKKERKGVKNAVLSYTVEGSAIDGKATAVRVALETGRTHQIRVHMKHIGHTLFNDDRYGGNEPLKGVPTAKYKQFVRNCFEVCPRQALHAKTLGFVHPRTKEMIRLDSKLPDDMQALIDKWRKYAENMVPETEE